MAFPYSLNDLLNQRSRRMSAYRPGKPDEFFSFFILFRVVAEGSDRESSPKPDRLVLSRPVSKMGNNAFHGIKKRKFTSKESAKCFLLMAPPPREYAARWLQADGAGGSRPRPFSRPTVALGSQCRPADSKFINPVIIVFYHRLLAH